MSGPATRVLAVLELLQTQGRMSGPELAQRLGVDKRTVRRYITMLEDLGIPITTERGREGAYMLVAGFKLPPMMFTDDEALALSVGLLAARGLQLGESAAAVSAQAKLERVMPVNLKQRVRAIDETVTLDLSRPREPCDPQILGVLSAASRAQSRVQLQHRSEQNMTTERDFDCYGLVYRDGRWYGVGMCHLRNALRTLRLDRISRVRLLTANFTRPIAFDAASHLTQSVATIPRSYSIEVLLRTDLATAQRSLFPSAGILESTDAGVLLRAQADDIDWFARELARLPFAFEIIAPAALREALRTIAGRLLMQT